MADTECDLWRSVRAQDFADGTILTDGQPAPGVLYPDFYPREIKPDKFRAPDVDIYTSGGVEWVQPGGGTSLFDRQGVFSGADWASFKIPQGTVIPASLLIVATGENKRLKAFHYQIECNRVPMTLEAYKGALDNLARNAIVQLINSN